MELLQNQAALILEASDEGEITVNLEAAESSGMAKTLCRAIANKLLTDESFQAELMEMLEEDEE